MPKILIVEDDTDINNMIRESLERSGYECEQAFSGTEGLFYARQSPMDLILLDLMLPGIGGERVLSELRADPGTAAVPVIVLSARDGLDSKIDLLNSGAEDYLTKPFEIEELIARIGVRLRRAPGRRGEPPAGTAEGSAGGSAESLAGADPGLPRPAVLRHRQLELNRESFSAVIAGEPLTLTRLEYRILELLMAHPNRVFTKQDIYDYAWEDHYIGEDKTINVHVSNIRKKLKAHTDDEYIETVWGIGFRLAR